MGQYWYPINLTKREFIHPHKLGCGLKLWEQLANHPGTGVALIILTAAMPEQRGGGDLDLDEGETPLIKDMKEAAGISYAEIAKRTIGRWAGDRIALVGDYAEPGDLAPEDNADLICDLCDSDKGRLEQVNWLRQQARKARGSGDHNRADEVEDEANRLAKAQLYRDITDDVCAVMEHELDGKFVGEGWRHFESAETGG